MVKALGRETGYIRRLDISQRFVLGFDLGVDINLVFISLPIWKPTVLP
jgi:hypothetical protein